MTVPTRQLERGLANSTAWAVLVPLLLTLVLGLVQTGVWLHARQAAATAAQTASEHLAGLAANEPAARDTAHRMASRAGLAGVRVEVTRTASEVSVEVTGAAPMMLPGEVRVSARATHPLERVSRP